MLPIAPRAGASYVRFSRLLGRRMQVSSRGFAGTCGRVGRFVGVRGAHRAGSGAS